MERTVERYKGTEIGPEQITKIKEIAKLKYSQEIYMQYFDDIETGFDLAVSLHGIFIDEENLVLGKDWFLCYKNSDWIYNIEFLEWVSLNSVDNISRLKEMMNELKTILLDNYNKIFSASLRHNTSYKMYLKMINKGLFRRLGVDQIYMDVSSPKEILKIRDNYLMYGNISVDDYLDIIGIDKNSKELNYVLHKVYFEPTDKFIDKYSDSKKIKSKTISKTD